MTVTVRSLDLAREKARRERVRSNLLAIVGIAVAIVAWVVIVGGLISAYITHVVVCIKASTWLPLAFGCIVAPIGIVHGICVWLGVL